MNSLMHRFGPPALVFGAALYLGWPPAAPLDLGESVAKAKAVRWKKDDLLAPPTLDVVVDPFRQVLIAKVAKDEMKPKQDMKEAVVESMVPERSSETIKSELELTGIANMGGRYWAIVNGKPHLKGDTITTGDSQEFSYEIIAIQSDHVVVRNQKTSVTLRPKPFGKRMNETGRKPAVQQPTPQPQSFVPPPPTTIEPPQA